MGIGVLCLLMLTQPLEQLKANERFLLCLATVGLAACWCITFGVSLANSTGYIAFRWLGLAATPLLWAFYLRFPVEKSVGAKGFAKLGSPTEFEEDIADRLRREKAAGLGKDIQLIFGGLALPFESSREGNFLVVGDIGSGKTTIIKEYMQSLIPHVHPSGRIRAVVFDAKNQLLPFLEQIKHPGASIHTLDPGLQSAYAWDFAADCTSYKHAEGLAGAIVHERQGGKNSDYFVEMSRLLAKQSMLSLNSHRPGNWDLLDVLFTILNPDWRHSIIPNCPEGQMLLQNLGSQETFDNVMSSVLSHFGRFTSLASEMRRHRLAGRTINSSQWLQNPSILVLGKVTNSESSLAALNRMIIDQLKTAITSEDNNASDSGSRSFFILDEFLEFGPFTALSDLMRLGRDSGACSLLAFQNISDLYSKYQDKHLADSVLDHTSNRIYLKMKSQTAEWAAAAIGRHPLRPGKQITTNMRTGDRNESETVDAPPTYDYVVHPSQLQNLPVAKFNGVTGYLHTGLSSIVPQIHLPWDRVLALSADSSTNLYAPCPAAWERVDPAWVEAEVRSCHPQRSDQASSEWFDSLLDSLERFAGENN